MKVAITSQGKDLAAPVDERFGRCRYFIIADTESGSFTALENAGAMASGGAGIQAAQALADRGVEAVITGYMGPKAMQTLQAAGIKVYAGASGSVGEALAMFKEGKLGLIDRANVNAHFGMR
ncbi:MAG: hypothetical protein PWP65_1852 [Clostridia bacterium]|nr:hypothetical protein [Clostridia bacterium]